MDKIKPITFNEIIYPHNIDDVIPLYEPKLAELISHNKGIPKGINIMLIGDPGSGKSTVCLDILSQIQNKGYKGLYISSEMNEIEIRPYMMRFNRFKNIPLYFPNTSSNILSKLENLLNQGEYNVVIVDSILDLTNKIKINYPLFTENMINEKLFNLLENNNSSGNNTTFILIQQMTKGGVFVGSNEIKHITTGTMEIRIDKEGVTYMFFSKNRRGPTNKKLKIVINSNTIDYSNYEKTIDDIKPVTLL